MRKTTKWMLGAALLADAATAAAQTGYPRKPILMLVPLFPDTPTVGESGLPGFVFTSWFGIVAPAGTPKEIVARLHAEIAKAANAPEVRDKLVGQGFSVLASTPEELARATRDQLERYSKIFKQAGIRIE